ncbi:efflux RND transporter periplasmic adaptor subunit [Rahnella contaminans]|uniref:efflux RND transporter periplasmic adaptor subunit n=1 Tax=Rahnella contaminans TaxID=2703882 RepID=UPI003C304459
MKKFLAVVFIPPVMVLSLSLLATGCDGNKDHPLGKAMPQVNVITVKAAPISITTDLPGRTSAFRIAEVRPQVSGIILKRNFIEGSDVKEGESLYQIDPSTYQATYDSALGDLAKAKAASVIAHLTVQRYKPLLTTHYVSQQDYDSAVATAQQSDASVYAAKAAAETAHINLTYTQVSSPISGRVGKSSVTEGALVTNEQAANLATVQQIDPIYVDLTQSSNDFLSLKQALKQGSLQKNSHVSQVNLVLENGQLYPLQGKLEFSDITVDESTGSITLRAIFPNPHHDLLPGMFVRARVDEGIQNSALLVPQQGVTRNPRGDATLMLVNAMHKVELRNVVASKAIGDKWLITEGLEEGDKVIVSGLQLAKPGVTVETHEVNSDEVTPTAP